MSEFSYLSEKVHAAEIIGEPFPHIYIRDLFTDVHFNRITSSPQIHFNRTRTSAGLIARSLRKGYRPQKFPGCTTNVRRYLRSVRRDEWPGQDGLVEGFGLTLRLQRLRDPWLGNLPEYLNGDEFQETVCNKWHLTQELRVETAIQKYLTVYEISPHPDIRKKLATYMVNINDPRHEDLPDDLNTQLLRFHDDWQWIHDYWAQHDVERCWVPWEWCEVVTKTTHNNSLVMFAPNDRHSTQ